MPTVHYHGPKADLIASLHALPRVFAGREADSSGAVKEIQLRMGSVLLGKIKESYTLKSQGGTDAMGLRWKPLSPVTLALRRKTPTAKVVAKLEKDLATLPKHRQRLIQRQRERLFAIYRADAMNSREARQARRYAQRLVHLMGPYLAPSRRRKLLGELREQTPLRAYRLSLSGAFAEILRDTGRLLNSLSPALTKPADQILEAGNGKVMVGSNVKTKSGLNLLNLHDSDKPRKKKKDGTDRLPRRQVLPDAAHPMPAMWRRDVSGAVSSGLRQPAFWRQYLGSRAA